MSRFPCELGARILFAKSQLVQRLPCKISNNRFSHSKRKKLYWQMGWFNGNCEKNSVTTKFKILEAWWGPSLALSVKRSVKAIQNYMTRSSFGGEKTTRFPRDQQLNRQIWARFIWAQAITVGEITECEKLTTAVLQPKNYSTWR